MATVLREAQTLVSLEKMFEYKSKLRSRVPEKMLKRYKELYFYLRDKLERGELPQHPDYLSGSELAESIYKRKYYLKDLNGNLIEKRPEEVFVRISAFLAAVEESRGKEIAEEYYKALYESLFVPGGRIIAGAGDLYRFKTLANCFVSIIEEDSLEAIYKTAYEAARTFSYGGGIGIDLSPLRPAGSVVHNAADSSTGAVSFAELYSLTTGLIGQSGRRGALMLTIDIKHPDVIAFMKMKSEPNWVTRQIIQQLRWSGKFTEEQLAEIERKVVENTQVRFANISVKVSDEFMSAVVEQNEFGDKYLLYKKGSKKVVMDVFQDGNNHYSVGMPSKDLSKYELISAFDSFAEMAAFVKENYGVVIDEEAFKDAKQRDVYGDYVVQLEGYDYDLALRQAGDFLLYWGSKEVGSIKKLVKARDIWNLFVESNYRSAEPGIMFWTKMTKYSNSNYVGRPIIGTNPCGEVPLEDGGACNLGSINLSRFVLDPFTEKARVDYEKLEKAVKTLVRLLDAVIDWNAYLNALEKQREAAKLTRRIGLGVMGVADMLLQLGLAYDSEEGIKAFEEVIRFIANKAYEASIELAEEKGPFPAFKESLFRSPFFKALDKEVVKKAKEKGLRNVAVLSIAPTGTISNIAVAFTLDGKNYIGVSSGIEPVFALYYKRRSESLNKIFKVFHPIVQAYLDMHGLGEMAQERDEEGLKEVLPPHFFRTAHHIDPLMRVKIQGVAQRYIDHSISSTINLPEDIEPEVMSDIYIAAWKEGLKGVTVYRDGSRYPILSVEGEETEFQRYKNRKFKIIVGEKTYIAKGDDVLYYKGRLTTVYHALKKGLLQGSAS
ncbi:MAG: adenosylcobalamin-dependent ribonucleoside-diphosphate reductase [Crenarchaeota archaeon]|nr:adenosylcobalamin-dependent ribonucleoside-diphosphate reductase [Thermoproteota archaeon]